jgi:hypothetical protein
MLIARLYPCVDDDCNGSIQVSMLVAWFDPSVDANCMVQSNCRCRLHGLIQVSMPIVDGSIRVPMMLAWFDPCLDVDCMFQSMS